MTSAEAERVTLWWMQVGHLTEAVLQRWSGILDQDERAQAGRFRFPVDRETYIAAHMLARSLLAHLGGRPAADWRFTRGEHGKPDIEAPPGSPPMRFNLSHSRGLVTCAAGFVSGDIGVDVEAAQRTPDLVTLGERFFAPAEVALLRAAPQPRQRHTFLRIWTLKEAFIKATGEGLSRALDSFAFGLDPIAVTVKGGDVRRWHFLQFDADERHVIALATTGDAATRVDAREVHAADL